MIVVKIELWPHGNPETVREIGRIVIANDGTGTRELGNYNVALAHAGIYSDEPGAWKSGTVTGHKRSLSPYHLISKAINTALKGRVKHEWADKYIEYSKLDGYPKSDDGVTCNE